MAAIVHVEGDFAVPPERLWADATDYGWLARICAPLVAFEGLPAGRCKPGQKLDLKVRIFGWLPAQDYRIEIVDFDDAAMCMRSQESGSGVDSWRHTITVEPCETGSRLTDHVEIEAGWRTPVIAAWARYLYRHRHRRRRQLLALEGSSS